MGRLICLKGVLITPFILSTKEGNHEVQKNTFYEGNFYFQLDTSVYPWKIVNAVRIPVN